MSRFTEILDKMNGEEVLEEAITRVSGTELSPALQAQVKRDYKHRYTGDNKPDWVKQTWKDGKPYPLHFKNDAQWLEKTTFAVKGKPDKLTGKYTELSKSCTYCNSSPTYPNNPELRKTVEEGISSIGWLNSEDKDSVILTPVFDGETKPKKVKVPKTEYKACDGDKNKLKKLALKYLKESLTEGIVYEEVGKKIIDMLFLKTDKDGRVETAWGTKTPKVLGDLIVQIVEGKK